jgi:hypothetical protein
LVFGALFRDEVVSHVVAFCGVALKDNDTGVRNCTELFLVYYVKGVG